MNNQLIMKLNHYQNLDLLQTHSSLLSLVIGKPITALISIYQNGQPASQPDKQTWLWRSHHDLRNKILRTGRLDFVCQDQKHLCNICATILSFSKSPQTPKLFFIQAYAT